MHDALLALYADEGLDAGERRTGRSSSELYGRTGRDRRAGSVATGAEDTYGMFFVNGIERLREGGRLCLITNDSFRSLTTYAALRRHILDRAGSWRSC